MKSSAYKALLCKYHPGDVVYAKENPSLLLVVRKYVDNVYYCMVKDESVQKQLVYFERDLLFPEVA